MTTNDESLIPEVVPPEGDSPRRRRRRSSRRRQLRRRLLGALALLGCTFGLLYFATAREFGSPAAVRVLHDIDLAATPVVAPRPAGVTRAIYRHSVIPGGVFSRGELAVAMATDPVAAEHYQDFDVTQTKVIRVDQPRAVHVSYRIGNKVYWTRNKVLLQRGEALLTDGVQVARGRCGNRVADVIPGPVAPEEPPIEALDEPLAEEPPGITPLRGFDLMFAEAPPFIPPQPLAFEADPIPSTPISIVPTPPVLIVEESFTPPGGEVPEPGTLVLLGTGALALARQFRRRQANPAR